MGERANYVIKQGERVHLYYSHWGAQTITRDLFWGPEHARRFIRVQESVSNSDGWLDLAWAEGGALLDEDARHLIFFGGEVLEFNIPIRRVFMDWLDRAWEGWTTEWAEEGIEAIARAAGCEAVTVLPKNPFTPDLSLRCSLDNDTILTLLSVQRGRQLVVVALENHLVDILVGGPDWILSQELEGPSSIDASRFTIDNPTPWAGVHLDPEQKKILCWSESRPFVGWHKIKPLWAGRGWEFSYCGGRFEAQEEITNGQVQFLHPDPEVYRDGLIWHLLDDSTSLGPQTIEFILGLRDEGHEVEVNPHATSDVRTSVPIPVRSQILRKILGGPLP